MIKLESGVPCREVIYFLRPSADWMRPTYIREGDLLYLRPADLKVNPHQRISFTAISRIRFDQLTVLCGSPKLTHKTSPHGHPPPQTHTRGFKFKCPCSPCISPAQDPSEDGTGWKKRGESRKNLLVYFDYRSLFEIIGLFYMLLKLFL